MVNVHQALAAAQADLNAAHARFLAAQQAAAEAERQAAAERSARRVLGPSKPVQWTQVKTVNNYQWRCDARSPLYDPNATQGHGPTYRSAPDPFAQAEPAGAPDPQPQAQPSQPAQPAQPAPNQAQQPRPGPAPNQAPQPPAGPGTYPQQHPPGAGGWPGAHAQHQGPPPGSGATATSPGSMGILVPNMTAPVYPFQPPIQPPALQEPPYPPPIPVQRNAEVPSPVPEPPAAPVVAAPSVPPGPRKRGRRPKTLAEMGLPRKVKEALAAGRTTYLKGPRPQRYTEQERKDVILYLIHHRVYADPRQMIRRLGGCPPSEIRNGWVYRSPTAVEAAAFFDIPNSTIANWWDKRNLILTGEGKKKKLSEAEARRADRDRKRAKAAARRRAMIAELEAADAEGQRALAAQLAAEQEDPESDGDSDDALDEDESEDEDEDS